MNKEIMNTDFLFSSPVYTINKKEWLSDAIKVTDKLIDAAYKKEQPRLKERESFLGKKDYKKIKDHGMSYHSSPLNNIPELKEMEDYIIATSYNLLDEWGYDIEKYQIHFTEFWAQEFSKNGGGHHETHVHWDNHISGFYFLKCSDKTSYPILHDPRAGAMMTKLPQKDVSKSGLMSDSIFYNVEPGKLMFFPSYIPHQFTVDNGLEPFRFIHFNLQAIRKDILTKIESEK